MLLRQDPPVSLSLSLCRPALHSTTSPILPLPIHQDERSDDSPSVYSTLAFHLQNHPSHGHSCRRQLLPPIDRSSSLLLQARQPIHSTVRSPLALLSLLDQVFPGSNLDLVDDLRLPTSSSISYSGFFITGSSAYTQHCVVLVGRNGL